MGALSKRARQIIRSMEVNAVRMMLSVIAVSVGFLVLAPLPVVAHHAFSAEFDANRPVQLSGVITKMEWVKPHSWIHVDVRNGRYRRKVDVEGGTPNTLLRRGLRKQDLQPGTEVKVEAIIQGRRPGQWQNLTLSNGRALFSRIVRHRRATRRGGSNRSGT